MPDQDRRTDPALTRAEFYQWLSNSFRQHSDRNDIIADKVERLTLAVFGDGNGTAGIQDDVKRLVCVGRRVDTWLDGINRLGKFGSSLVIVLAAGATFAKSMGWL